MKHAFISLTLAAYALLLAACGATVQTIVNTIAGSGNIVTVERAVSGFTSVEIDMGANLALTQGDSEGLTIEADDNLMDYITTRVENGRLIISLPDNTNISATQPIALQLNFVDLGAIRINGRSDITGEDLQLDALEIDFHGSGSTRLSGTIDRQTISVFGQATIANFGVSSDAVNVTIAGNGTVEVDVANTLDVNIAGMGNVRYLGSPTVTRTIAGTGSVTQQQ